MLRNLSEKLRAKLPAATRSYPMVDDPFSEFFELEVSPVEGQLLQQKIRKGEKGKVQNKFKKTTKTKKPKDVGHFLVQK